MEKLNRLVEALKTKKAVVFTGAGVSTNSGISDFRSTEGFYSKYHEEDLSIETFLNKPDQFYVAFQEKFALVFDAKPNKTHTILAELESVGLIKGVITQNVDRLHQKAGSKNVIEFHGNIFCYDLIQITNASKQLYHLIQADIPYTKVISQGIFNYKMGSYIYKPQVVLYGEGISKWSESVTLAQSAGIHIIMGTSFLVSPFNMISYENRNKNLEVFIINNEPVKYNGPCTQIIGDTSDILTELLKKIRGT